MMTDMILLTLLTGLEDKNVSYLLSENPAWIPLIFWTFWIYSLWDKDCFNFVLEVELVGSKNAVVMRHSGDKGVRISSEVSFIYPEMQ